MAEGYTRQSTFSNGDVIDAALFNDEFNQLVDVFKKDVGHNHDGTNGAGAPVPFIEKGNSGVYIDTNVPTAPKIVFKVNGVTVSEAGGTTFSVTSGISHTPAATGTPVTLNTYLDTLQVAVGNASIDAAAAALSADRAEAAAMTLGVPVIVPADGTYTLLSTTVQADIICLGNAIINLPTTLTAGHRYSIRVSSTAAPTSQCVIMNPTYSIVGDLLTLVAGDNLVLRPKDIAVLDVLNSATLEII